jgi:hypothetical protein
VLREPRLAVERSKKFQSNHAFDPGPPAMKATMEAAEWHQPAPENQFGAAETF